MNIICKLLLWCILISFLACGAQAQHNHAQGHNEYSGWSSLKTGNCCNNQDCGDLADNEWREKDGRVEIEILGAWCPVNQEHYVVKGKSPDWTRAHACVNKNPNATFANPCDRLLCFMGIPKG